MNDRYLYRAKRTDNGDWVEGLLWKKKYNSNKIFIICFPDKDDNEEVFIVDEGTICQCTGLKRFFEKDIVKRTDIHKVGDPSIGTIEYDVENTAFVIHWIDKEKYSPMYPWKDKIEVIGNIFDNPELLEVG